MSDIQPANPAQITRDPASELSDQAIAEYETDYEIGQDNVEVMGLDIHNPVFFLSAALVLVFSLATLLFPSAAQGLLSSAKTFTLEG